MKNSINKQHGFTIVELVIVMLVIGILSAVAIPRLFNLGTQARKSAVLAVTSGLKTAVELAHAQWVSNSEPGEIIVDGNHFWMGEGVAGPGWPQNASSSTISAAVALSGEECLKLWNALLKSPPKGDTTANCTANNTCKFHVESIPNSDQCKFTDKDSNFIIYDRSNGDVTDTYNNA